jgi:hypothetical protein
VIAKVVAVLADMRLLRPGLPPAWRAASLDLAPGDPDVFDDGILRIRVTSSPPGLALAGDVDTVTFPNLVNVLKMITGGLVPVHVDFAEVTASGDTLGDVAADVEVELDGQVGLAECLPGMAESF